MTQALLIFQQPAAAPADAAAPPLSVPRVPVLAGAGVNNSASSLSPVIKAAPISLSWVRWRRRHCYRGTILQSSRPGGAFGPTVRKQRSGAGFFKVRRDEQSNIEILKYCQSSSFSLFTFWDSQCMTCIQMWTKSKFQIFQQANIGSNT